jgi:predicted CXXCH cytochrome family protein
MIPHFRSVVAAALLGAAALTSCSDSDKSVQSTGAQSSSTASTHSSACIECHAEQHSEWSQSHHALAEQVLEANTVSVKATGPDGAEHSYPAIRSIGVDPLIQYVVDLDGRLQVPQQAMDSHDGSWFDVFADGRQPGEWGHWTGRGMNWDTMCAVCHNTDLKRNWVEANDSFETTWSEHGVACNSCHDQMDQHVKNPDAAVQAVSSEQCWACHARRSELGPEQRGETFLDNYFPGLPDYTDTWHVDGQIRDEDFEYTSFALSKMHSAGVTCLDCHDPHTAKLRSNGDGLCMTCHSGGGRVPAPVIDTTTHSAHDVGTSGSACIDCHMSTTVYMQRHPRHDHGFVIPDPQLSIETGVPNACSKCHDDKSLEWAEIVEARPTWTGNEAPRRRARAMYAAREYQDNALPLLLAATKQETQSTWRASLLGMLQSWPNNPEAQRLLTEAATSTDPLQRAMAWPLPGLLEDPVRAVRLHVARLLPVEMVEESRAAVDLQRNMEHNRGQPTGAMQEAQYLLSRGQGQQALKLAEQAEQWERHSPAPLHLQATVLDSLGQTAEARAVMKRCCAKFSEDATSWYLLGLAAAAEQDYEATKVALKQALQLQPDFADAQRNLQAIEDFEKQQKH